MRGSGEIRIALSRAELTAVREAVELTPNFEGRLDVRDTLRAAVKARSAGVAIEREVAERPIEDPIAYDCYLRAYQLMLNWTPDAQRRAVRLVDEALAIAGEVPLLLAMKGQLRWNRVNIPTEAGELDLEHDDPAQRI